MTTPAVNNSLYAFWNTLIVPFLLVAHFDCRVICIAAFASVYALAGVLRISPLTA